MGQHDVIEFLERKENYRQWKTSVEIARGVGMSVPSTQMSLYKLRNKTDFIEWKMVKVNVEEYRYRCKKDIDLEIKYELEDLE